MVVWGHMEESLLKLISFSYIFFLVLWWRHRVGRLLLVVLVPPAPVVRFSDLPYVAVTTGGTGATGTTTLSGDSPAVFIRACVFLSVQWLAFPGFQWSCAFHTCEHRWPKWLRQSFVSESCSAQWAAEKLKVESWNLAMQGAHSCALVIIWSVIEIVGNGWIHFCPLECQLCVKTTKGWICPRVFSIHSVHLWAPLRFLTAAVLMCLRLWRCWQQ